MNNKIYIVFKVFVIEFTDLLATSITSQSPFLDFVKKIDTQPLLLYIFNRISTNKTIDIKKKWKFLFKFVLIFVSRWAPRNDDTSVKQINSTQLQTIVYLTWKLHSHSHSLKSALHKIGCKKYKIGRKSRPEIGAQFF